MKSSIQVSSLLLLLGVVGTTHACPYLQKTTEGRRLEGSALEAAKQYHHHHRNRQLQEGDGDRFVGTPEEAIADAKDWIQMIIQNDDEMGPKYVRLAFHDCVGGCDGCVYMDNPDNAGLELPISSLAEMVDFYSDQLTRADIWALAGVHAADLARESDTLGFFPFNFYGRPTCDDPLQQGEDVELPSAHLVTAELLDFFASAFGFNEQETVAIMGAHTLGELSAQNSGFNAPQGWVGREERLENEFYKLLLIPNRNPYQANGNYQQEQQDNGQFLWRLPRNNGGGGGGGGGRGGFVMLNADMALVLDLAGEIDSDLGTVACSVQDCPQSSLIGQVAQYASSNALWLEDFRDAFLKMILNGHDPCELMAVTGADCTISSEDGPSESGDQEETSASALASAASSLPSSMYWSCLSSLSAIYALSVLLL